MSQGFNLKKLIAIFIFLLLTLLFSLSCSKVPSSASTFSVDDYGFSPSAIYVRDTTTAGVTISGGDTGQYTVRFWRDIARFPDEKVGEFSFYHDGTTTTATSPFPFTPPITSGTYHMDMVFGDDYLWSQPDDASRLEVIDWGWHED